MPSYKKTTVKSAYGRKGTSPSASNKSGVKKKKRMSSHRKKSR